MKVKNKLKQICIEKEMTLADLADKYGMNHNAFYVKLSRNNLRFDTVEQLADCLDCDVAIVDRNTKKVY